MSLVKQGYCKTCASHLFYHLRGDDKLFLEHQIFIEEKPVYYSFSQKTKNMTRAEVFAEFGNS